ncbi:hypothetical protein PYW07_001614 [Mythimna separata]|uniref:Reverse transcriptase domain-containing protein n=1 Tax=Mythimna separata TaxID=271217 RepID=A0AAD7YTQ5_MYTSE|nr:hypothetical protein PYW07_001614 [Mythimna separata]
MLQKIKIDILGLAEVRRKGYAIEEHEDYIFCYKGETPGLHGVGFLIKKEHKNNIVSFTAFSDRVALLKMEYNNQLLAIIQVYAPTANATDEEINSFYEYLQVAQSQAGDNIFLIGDFNAKVGQHTTQDSENFVLGKFGYGNRNKRGEKLIQHALEYKLTIMNSFFKARKNRKWTWLSPCGNYKNEIDFILSSHPTRIRNVEVLHGFGFRSDHRLVRATYMLDQRKKSRTSFKSQPKPLKTDEDKSTYLKNLEINLHQLETEQEEDIQTFYNKLANIINTSLVRRLRDNEMKTTNKILSESTRTLLTRRTELLKTKHKTKEMKQELSILFKTTSKAIDKDYKDYRYKIIENNLNTYRSTKKAYKKLITHKNWIQNLKSKSEESKTRNDIMNCATDFYKELYSKTISCTSTTDIVRTNSHNINDLPLIHEKEVFDYIKKLKADKAPGPDGIQNEALKAGVFLLTHPLTYLFNKVLNTGQVPIQWKRSDIILLYKKGDPQDISNYRPISLLSSIYKLFTTILQSQLSKDIDTYQPVEQAGFRSGFSTMDHIQVLQQVMEKYKEFNRPLYIAFIDYTKAFDTISHDAIWEALNKCHINKNYIRVLKNIYEDSVSQVKLETRGPVIPICRGVRQGDPISPKLFIMVLQHIFDNLDWQLEGIRVNQDRLTHLRFADDIVLFAETSKRLEKMISTLNEESEKVGLKMNETKTKIMTNSNINPINLNGKPLEYVNNYIYLGKQLSFEDKSEELEVDRRINMSWKKFWSLKEILKGKYPVHLKKTVLDTCILPTLTYGCQTWTYNTKIKTKLVVCQKAMERSILKLRRIQKVKSEKIRQKTQVIDALQYALKQKWQWAGHIARYTDKRWTLESIIWKGPRGKRKRGRPRKRWIEDIEKVAGSEWREKAMDRELWKTLEEAFTREGVPINGTEESNDSE